jgi:hypothetical protein
MGGVLEIGMVNAGRLEISIRIFTKPKQKTKQQ